MSAFTAAQEAALAEVIEAAAPAAVVLIGAAAVDLHVPMHWRQTHDLDLVVAIELDAFHALDSRLVGWSHDPRREHAWRSPRGVDVDLVPAGPLLRARGEITFPRSGNVMDLSAIDLAFEHAALFPVGGRSVSVAPIQVLSLLKMVSWLDSPEPPARPRGPRAHPRRMAPDRRRAPLRRRRPRRAGALRRRPRPAARPRDRSGREGLAPHRRAPLPRARR